MRIALVTSYWEEGDGDPGNVLLRGLAEGMAAAGYQLEIFTTTSSAPASSCFGELVWNRYHSPGAREAGGYTVHRFPAARAGSPLHVLGRDAAGKWWERGAQGTRIAEYCRRALGEGRGMLCGGWHRYELWDDGPARWSREEGTLVLCGRSIEKIELRLQAPREQVVRIEMEGVAEEVPFSAGEEKLVSIRTSPRDSLLLRIRPGSMFRPAADRRKLGVALREVHFRDASACWDVEITHHPEALPEGDWERIPQGLAAELLAHEKGDEGRWRRRIGPFSAGLRRALAGRAGYFQVIIAARARHYTAKIALDAAERMAVPLVLLPLLLPREAAEDLPRFLYLAGRAEAVMDPDPAWRECMREMDKPFFHLPPFVLFTSGEASHAACREAEELRRHLGWEAGRGGANVLVSAEGSPQGERKAREMLRILQEKGADMRVAIMGMGTEKEMRQPEPVPEVGDVPDLSTSPAHVQRLLARLCDIYVQTGRSSDWGEKICLARASGGETVAWRECPVAASLRGLMGTGRLCGEAEDFARVVGSLLEKYRAGTGAGGPGRDAGTAAQEQMEDLRERCLADLLAWLGEIREVFSIRPGHPGS